MEHYTILPMWNSLFSLLGLGESCAVNVSSQSTDEKQF